ncbi:MAG: NF041680 family putative transposase [Dehalococcoidia bacterium]|nr:NF041680 family putative transposase [Dehalococcoidia bacterium]
MAFFRLVWHHRATMMHPDTIKELRDFRKKLVMLFGKRADALFELCDAAVTAGLSPSLAYLSLEAVHRRGWGSLYAALAEGEIDVDQARGLVARYLLANGQPIYAVDVSVWPRCAAETSPERAFYHHASRHMKGKPVVAGWAYQLIAQVSFDRDSWTAPLDAQRVHPREDTEAVAVEQIKALLAHLPAQADVPLFLFDTGYNSVALAEGLGETPAAILVRLRRDRCFYGDPPPSAGKGRPFRHGAKMAFKDPTTWPEPTQEHIEQDEQYGTVRVRAWSGLHAVVRDHETKGTRGPRPIVRGTVIRVEVSRLPGWTRKPQSLWLFYYGPQESNLALLWRAYIHRFDVEHTIRFFKQTLNWTSPRVRHPEQADLWTWLIVAAYTQLRLARACVADQRLPWERQLEPDKLTPYRVRRGFPSLLVALGTPANAPKPCGRSPGRPKGRRSGRATRYPALKKAA